MSPARELTLPPAPSSARTARRAVAEVVRERDPQVADTAELLASELVANAVQHAASPLHFRVEVDADRVRLAVRDREPTLPQRRDPSPDDLFGRGLLLVEDLASDWGAEPVPDDGKVVWCVVTA
jgi:anti-sigma regulatory factor (Ser/Thr protein kinase)